MDQGNDRTAQDLDDVGEYGLTSRTLGGLPIVNHILDRLGLTALLGQALGQALGEVDGRTKLAPATAIRLVITNLVLGREPLYALGEWAARYDPACPTPRSGRSTMTGSLARWTRCSTRTGPVC